MRLPVMRYVMYFSLTFCLLVGGNSHARIDIVEFEDPERQALYLDLIQELRCLVCQNQNLADSNADLALDLRRRTRELIEQGKDRKEIVNYMVKRYGEFVLYRPRLQWSTVFLWFSPGILLLVVIVMVVRFRRRQPDSVDSLPAEQLANARRLIQAGSIDSPTSDNQQSVPGQEKP